MVSIWRTIVFYKSTNVTRSNIPNWEKRIRCTIADYDRRRGGTELTVRYRARSLQRDPKSIRFVLLQTWLLWAWRYQENSASRLHVQDSQSPAAGPHRNSLAWITSGIRARIIKSRGTRSIDHFVTPSIVVLGKRNALHSSPFEMPVAFSDRWNS